MKECVSVCRWSISAATKTDGVTEGGGNCIWMTLRPQTPAVSHSPSESISPRLLVHVSTETRSLHLKTRDSWENEDAVRPSELQNSSDFTRTQKRTHSRNIQPIKVVLHLLPSGHAQVFGDSSYFWLHTLSHAKHFQEAVVFFNALGKQVIVCVCVCGINWKECVWTPRPPSVFALPECYEEWSGFIDNKHFLPPFPSLAVFPHAARP